MHIEEIIQKIVPADRGCMKLAQTRFDNLIKPVGSLAKLEEMLQIVSDEPRAIAVSRVFMKKRI